MIQRLMTVEIPRSFFSAPQDRRSFKHDKKWRQFCVDCGTNKMSPASAVVVDVVGGLLARWWIGMSATVPPLPLNMPHSVARNNYNIDLLRSLTPARAGPRAGCPNDVSFSVLTPDTRIDRRLVFYLLWMASAHARDTAETFIAFL